MKLADCHPQKKHKARGMCASCYDKWLKVNNKDYKEKQLSNTTKWALKNPDKMKALVQKRKEKERSSPEIIQKIKTRNRKNFLKRKYGISLEKYDKMLADQNGSCKLCFRKQGERKLHIDHCHETGIVRGLLCHQCNWYLGTIEADFGIIERIKNYLRYKYNGKT